MIRLLVCKHNYGTISGFQLLVPVLYSLNLCKSDISEPLSSGTKRNREGKVNAVWHHDDVSGEKIIATDDKPRSSLCIRHGPSLTVNITLPS